MKAKREASMHTQDTERRWYVGRCRKCGSAGCAVEAGEGDQYSRLEMVRLGYEVKQERGPVQFRPHSEECNG